MEVDSYGKKPLYAWQMELEDENNNDELDSKQKLDNFLESHDSDEDMIKSIQNGLDQDLLIEIAKRKINDDVRVEAIKHIDFDNQDFFIELATKDKYETGNVVIESIRMIRHQYQDVLIDLAKNHPNVGVRSIAIKKIIDPNEVAKIAMNDGSDLVLNNAFEGIHDKDILSELGEKYFSSNIAKHALRSNNSEVIVKIAKKNYNLNIRRDAIYLLNDETYLEDVALNANDLGTQAIATERITDENILKRILDNNKNEYIQDVVRAKLDNSYTPQRIEIVIKMIENEYNLKCTKFDHYNVHFENHVDDIKPVYESPSFPDHDRTYGEFMENFSHSLIWEVENFLPSNFKYDSIDGFYGENGLITLDIYLL